MVAASSQRNVTCLLVLGVLGALSCAFAASGRVADEPGAMEVTLSYKWKPNYGLQVKCSWKLKESFSTVKLLEDDRPFKMYQPEEKNMTEEHPRAGYMMEVFCTNSVSEGMCTMSMELHQPQSRAYRYGCEVTGGSPMFRQKTAYLEIPPFVKPTEAVIEVKKNKETGRVCLICRSSGVPPPRLVWTVGGETVPGIAEPSSNVNSKLHDVWSERCDNNDNQPVICTPEIDWNGEVIKGTPATYSSAHIVAGLKILVVALSLSVILNGFI